MRPLDRLLRRSSWTGCWRCRSRRGDARRGSGSGARMRRRRVCEESEDRLPSRRLSELTSRLMTRGGTGVTRRRPSGLKPGCGLSTSCWRCDLRLRRLGIIVDGCVRLWKGDRNGGGTTSSATSCLRLRLRIWNRWR